MKERPDSDFITGHKPTRHWEDFDGESDKVKKLNAFLTQKFIWAGAPIPKDECLVEARQVLAARDADTIRGILVQSFTFGTDDPRLSDCAAIADEVMKIKGGRWNRDHH